VCRKEVVGFNAVSWSYMIYFPTDMARYSLFVLKVPLNTKQTNKTINGTSKFLINTDGTVHYAE